MGPREKRIHDLLMGAFAPVYLSLENESSQHSVPPGSETHFKLVIAAKAFEGASRVERQRQINAVLAEEFRSGLHALTQRVLSPAEWEQQKSSMQFESPECLGGSKADQK